MGRKTLNSGDPRDAVDQTRPERLDILTDGTEYAHASNGNAVVRRLEWHPRHHRSCTTDSGPWLCSAPGCVPCDAGPPPRDQAVREWPGPPRSRTAHPDASHKNTAALRPGLLWPTKKGQAETLLERQKMAQQRHCDG